MLARSFVKRSNESRNERRFTRYASRITGVEQDQWVHIAVRALARGDRTTAQIERLLATKGASPTQIRAAVRQLTSLKYLDDEAFASRWVERRLSRMPMGRARLQDELLATGCAEHIVHTTLRAAYRKISEQDLARLVLMKASRTASAKTPGRVARLLSQRGFDEDTIEIVMGPLMRDGS
jgi:regulatory protein